ncbi:MAG: pectate lyase [Prevotella sp.]|nr:pectate lyase [Prevotella sp.]
MKRLTLTFILTVTLIAVSATAQRPTMRFKKLAYQMPTKWFATAEAQAIADTVVKYQFPSGGWAKNNDWNLPADEGGRLKARQEVWQQIHSADGVGATIDNGATTSEMLLLAKVYEATGKKKYREAFIRGLNYLLEAQYDNGGWPQYYPFKPLNSEGHAFYSNHITFNDNAMVNVLTMMREVYEERTSYYKALRIPDKLKQRLHESFDRGIECILNCQIRKDGRLTVWCQQHDEKTFAPAPARSYELASFTGSHETPNILELLMSLPNPSDRVVEAVTAAVEWLKAHALKDVRLESFVNAEGQRDRRLVHHFGATTWARYYDLDTEEPYVCDRDGRPQPSLEYIGHERRNGYGWYGETPREIIEAFPAWLSQVRPQ